MLLYCLKSIKNTGSKNAKVARIKSVRIMLLSKYGVCDSKTSKFIKEEKPSGLFSSLERNF